MDTEAPCRILTLDGELDVASARRMSGALSEAVGDKSHDLVVDLRGVTFMDSTALGALVRAATQMRNQGRRLTINVAPGPVEQLLEDTGLRPAFEVG